MRKTTFGLAILLSLGWASDPADAFGDKIDIKFATAAPADTPWHNALLSIQDAVEKNGDVEAEFRLFMGSQLGGELEIMDSLMLGIIEMIGVSTVAVANIIPEMNLFELPFLWNSSEESYYVLDNVLLEEMQELFAAKGLIALGWTENGWRHFMSRTEPILKLEDLQGFKVRSAQNRYHLEFWKRVGANARPIGMTEIFNALQTGQVDGLDNTLIVTAATGWVETLSHATLSYHMYQPGVILVKKDLWDAWPADLQKTLRKAVLQSQHDTRRQLTAMEPELKEAFKAMGVQVHQLPEKERDRLRKAVQPVVKLYEKEYGSRLLDLVKKGQREFSEKQGK